MKDELHKQILKGLSAELHGNDFEAAAVDLLQSIYPSLTPIKGGGDSGRDGHFFNINGVEGILVCTTGEKVGDNLRRNLKEYVKNGHKGRAVIVATSRALSPKRQDKLDSIAKEEGFKLLKVHEQSDFALRLYRDKAWLKKLLNLESNQQALSINPITDRPLLSLSIRGRDDVLKWLDETATDSLIVGQPGSGKTFVVRHFIMEHDGLFVVSENTDQIIAEVREKKPSYLVVDDAHTKPSLIKALRQLREDSGAEFKIIATAWTSFRDQLQNDLVIGDGAIFELELQGRDTILDIIKDCGVKSPDRLLYQMVTQAEGKPGLAATLSHLVLAGDAEEVYIGDALGKHLVALFDSALGTEARELLAVVALGGDAGISLKNAASILGTTEIKISTLAAKLSFGGVIVDLPPSAISVRPAPLRYYLAKQVFFNSGAAIDPTPYLNKYENSSDVAEVILNAGLRGGTIDKEALYNLIKQSGIPKLFSGYAVFGRNEAQRVIEEHPTEALKAPRDLLTVYPEGILPLMLEAAESDDRALNSNPDHPFRIIKDWCMNIDEGYNDPLPRRKALIKVLVKWRQSGKDPKVFTHGLTYALIPHFEIHRSDPGAGNSFSWGGGHLNASGMQDLLKQWKAVQPLIKDLPDDAWSHLVDLLEEWAYEQRSLGDPPSTEQRAALHEGAVTIIDDLTEFSASQPGIQARLRELAHHLKHTIKTTTNREYDIIYPHEADRRDWQKNTAKQAAAAKKLASEYATQPPLEVLQKLINASKQAAAANKTYPDHTSTIASELSSLVTDLSAWTDASIDEWNRSDVSFPFLFALQSQDPEAAKPLLLKALNNDSHRSAAIQVILRRPYQEDDLWRAAYPLIEQVPRLADAIVLRQQADGDTTVALLKYPTGDVALLVADAIAHLTDGNIPAVLEPIWEDAVINYQFTGGHSSSDNHVSIALKSHPTTIAKWLKAKVNDEQKSYYDGFSREAMDVIPELSQEARIEVIRSLTESARSELIAHHLVGADTALFEELLANKNTRSYQLRPLSHVDHQDWVDFAELALKAGWDDDEVASYTTSMSDHYSGSAADHWLSRKARFDEGLESSNPRIIAIAKQGVETYQSLHELSLKRERKEDIYGL